MKLSALFVSVNILAAAPLAAHAADAVSDKADWLKRQLSSPSSARASRSALSIDLSDPSLGVRVAPVTAFVPGKKLPTRKQLEALRRAEEERLCAERRQREMPLVAQEAVYDHSAEPLTGSVSENVAIPQSDDSSYFPYSSSSTIGQPLPQRRRAIVTHAVRRAPNPVSTQAATAAPLANPWQIIPEPPPMAPGRQLINSLAPLSMVPVKGREDLMHKVRNLAGSLSFSPQEQAVLDGLFSSDAPQAAYPSESMAYEQSDLSSTNGFSPEIGSPPFPLNMLPPETLRQFLRGGQVRPGAGAPSGFGSWRGYGGPSTGGFHSFIGRRRLPSFAQPPSQTVSWGHGHMESRSHGAPHLVNLTQQSLSAYAPYGSTAYATAQGSY